MKKLKKYTGIGLGIIAAPVVIYGVYKTNVAPELINNKNNSLFLLNPKQGLSFPRSSAKPNVKKSTALDLDLTLKSAGNIEKKFQIMINTSNITDGWFANIFEDSSGNLWSMGLGTPLQVLRKGKNIWEPAGHSSNITDGKGGTIFEDSSGNLWSMGNNTPLQVLKKGDNNWRLAGKHSNITDGWDGTIFEDSSGNLWSMGNNRPLQVLEKNETEWKSSLGSNIKDGTHGTIYEDSKGTLWSMANGTALQFLKKDTNTWVSAGNGSNITDGRYGDFFEDSSGNLWSMGNRTPLQVLRKGRKTWEEAGHKSNITNGNSGSIFEDSSGNLWGMGTGKPLQVLKKGKKNWENSKGSNIKDGGEGTIFEDSSGNLWSMGYGTPLQVLKKGSSLWRREALGSNVKNGSFGKLFEDSEGNLWSATKEGVLQVKPFGLEKWINNRLTPKSSINNSNITDGWYGTIFEDSSGNLWSMGKHTPLQVLRKGKNIWEPAGHSSNITDGWKGTIFEDSSGNLWSTGNNTPLQVLKKGKKDWQPAAAHGSNITNGATGTIFEDSSRNLWSMGAGTPLQVLRKGATEWEPAGHNSNITDGHGGTIFEDSSGNLWSMGNDTPLQVLRKGATEWEPAGHNSNITDGWYGTIFEDSSGNLWSMGFQTPLQVLKKGKTEWEPAGHSSNITDGKGGGTIFEDSSGNLWSMGWGTPLQVLKKGGTEWEPAGHSSNITDGEDSTIFEDSSGNLWSMGYGTPLQVLRKGATEWEPAGYKSNIANGGSGTIFEDSSGNLWSTGKGTPLQVFPAMNKLDSTKFSNKYSLSLKDNRFNLEGDLSGIKRKYFKLKYKLLTDKAWKDFDTKGVSKDVITTGEYQFKWVINSNFKLTSSSKAIPNIPNQIVVNAKDITGRPIKNKSVTSYIGANDGKITLPTTGLPTGVTIQVNKGSVEVTDLEHLTPGTYSFKYILGENFLTLGTLPKLKDIVVAKSTLIGLVVPIVLNTTITGPTYITNEGNGTIYEDSSGNLWSMGSDTPLQVLRNGKTEWELAAHNSNITNGTNGTIYEDSFGNLWSMGYWTPLQVLRKGATNWEEAGHNSNITNGEYGTIFEDSKGNLWSMGDKSSLQVLKNGSSTWTSANNSNITDGQGGTIFEDSRGNLWSMGRRTPLQVLRKGATSWKEAGISSNITDGLFGTIFEDSKGNLWSMGNDTSLQVLRKGENTWESARHSSNITDGEGGTIFEDSSGNLWSMGNVPSLFGFNFGNNNNNNNNNNVLQVLKKNSTTWVQAKGSNILDGYGSTIYEDSSGNLWSKGQGTPLQVLRKGSFTWKEAAHGSTTKNSSIKNGMFVSILEDSSGNLWSMGQETPLQVLKKATKGWNKIFTKKVSSKYNLSLKDNRFNLEGDLSDIKRKYFKLKYKLLTDKAWKDFGAKGISEDVVTTGEYEFKWAINSNWKSALSSKKIPNIPNKIVINKFNTTKSGPAYKNAADATIKVTTTIPTGSKLQYRKNSEANWTDVPANGMTGLTAGTYHFQYVLDATHVWIGGAAPTLNDVVINANSKDGVAVPTDFKTTTTSPTYKNAVDATINVTATIPSGATLQYQKDGESTWTDVPKDKVVKNLSSGTYHFQYVLDATHVWIGGVAPTLNDVVINANSKDGVAVPTDFNTTKTIPAYKNATDATINVTATIPSGATLQYQKDGESTWTDVPKDKVVKNLSSGTYHFQYVLDATHVWIGGSAPTLNDVVINANSKDGVAVPTDFKTTTTSPTYKNAVDATINVTATIPSGATLQYQKDGESTWTDVPKDKVVKNLSSGTYHFQYVLDATHVWIGGAAPTLNDVVINANSKDGVAVPTDFKTTTTSPTYKNAVDATINVTATIPSGATLQYQKDGESTWTDVPKDKVVKNLSFGTYHFQYVLDATHVWIGGSAPTLTDVVINANPKDGVAVPTDFKTTTTSPTYKNAVDATINVTATIPSGATLQYQKVGETNWTDVPTNGITGLAAGTYHFQYVLDATHVWIGGAAPTLNDVVINANSKDGVAVPTDFKTTTTSPTYKNAVDATINVTATIPSGATLQYQKVGETNWTDVPTNGITGLAAGTYHFQYVLDAAHVWIGGSAPTLTDVVINANSKDGVAVPTDFKTTTTSPTYKNAVDATINVTATIPSGATLQYQKDGESTWTDVPKGKVVKNLSSGTYHFQYVLDATHVWIGGVAPTLNDVVINANSKDGVAVPTDFNTTTTSPTYKNAVDATINVTATIPSGATLQYQKDGESTWTDVPKDKVVKNLSFGTYHFQYVLDATHVWIGGSAPTLTDVVINANSKDGVAVPTDFNTTKTIPTYKNATDATINVTATIPSGATLQYQKDGESTWTDVPKDKVVKNLSSGTYHFQYVLDATHVWIGGAAPTLNDVVINANSKDGVAVPTDFNTTKTIPTYKNATDATINVTATIPSGATLQYQKDGESTWTDVPKDKVVKNLSSGTYHFQYVLDATHVWIGGAAPTLNDVVINANSKVGVTVPTFNTTKTIPTYKGATDATINVTATIPNGATLQYQKVGETNWTDVPANGMTGLTAGTYHFQYVLDATHVWIGGVAPTLNDVVINANSKVGVTVPTFNTTKTIPTYKGATDATINVTATIPNGATLQYQKVGETNWTDVPANGMTGLTAGTYHFQYVLDATHVWIGGVAPTLNDVVINANSKDGVAVPTGFNTTKTIPTYKGATDATINVTTTIPTGSKLQYQKVGETNWTDVPTNGITGLAAGTYHFQYVLDATHVWIGGSAPTLNDVVINANSKDGVAVPTDFKTTTTSPTYKNAVDATINVTATIPSGATLQYQKDGESTWTDVPKDKVVKNLSSGTYHFQYVLDATHVWIGGVAPTLNDVVINANSKDGVAVPTDFKTTTTSPTYKNAVDATINVTATIPSGATLQYQKVGETNWTDVPTNGITGLAAGTYHFQYVLDAAHVWIGGSAPTLTDVVINANSKDGVAVPTDFKTTTTSPTYKNAVDATINVTATIPSGATLQYQKVGETNWTDVPTNGITGLAAGTYHFQYVLDAAHVWIGGSAPTLTDVVINANSKDGVAVPTDFKTTTTSPTYKNAVDATINVTATIPSGATLQYQKDGESTWTDVPKDKVVKNLSSGTYHFQYVLDATHVWIGGAAPTLNDVVINANSKDGVAVPTDFKTTTTSPTYKNTVDATINVTATIPSGATLQYQKDGESTWTDVPKDKVVKNLSSGTYHFQYVLDATHVWIGGAAPTLNDVVINANSKVGVTVPTFNTTKTIPTYKNATDATINVTATIPSGATLQYQKDGESTWTDVPKDKVVKNLSSGTYHFQYVLDATHVWIGGAAPTLNDVVINANSKDGVAVPTFNTTKTIPTYKGATDATINVTATIPNGATLQYQKDGKTNWTDVPTNGITGLAAGTYHFQYVLDATHVWIGGAAPTLNDVVINANSKDGVAVPTFNTTKTIPTYKGATDATINVTTTIPTGSKLQYQKDGESTWTDVPTNGITGLAVGTYHFQYVLDATHVWIGGSAPTLNDVVINANSKDGVAVPTDFKTTTTSPTYKNAVDATINVTATIPSGATLQYQKDGESTWTDVPKDKVVKNLSSGTYHFQYVLDATHVWIGGVAPTLNDVVINANSKDGVAVPTDFKTTTTSPTYKNAVDATINVTATIPSGATLQYQKVGETNWTDVPTNGITGLAAGTYHFQYVLDAAHVWIGGSAPTLTDVVINANSKDGVAVPTDFKTTTTSPTYKNAVDATINVTATIPSGATLQYQKDGESTWTDVPKDKVVKNLSSGTYHFQYVLDATHVWIGGAAPTLNDVVINANSKDGVAVPTDFKTTTTSPTYKNAVDATINVTATIPSGATLQYQKDGESTWTDVPKDKVVKNLSSGTYHFQYVLDATHVWIGGAAPTLNDVVINANSKDGVAVPTDFKTTTTSPTYKNAVDATINVTATIPSGATLQYQKDGESTWTDVPKDKVVKNLSFGTYHFQYVLDATHVWIGGSAPTLTDVVINANPKDGVTVPTFNTTKTIPTYKGATDATINVTTTIPIGSKLQYQKDGETNWTDVPTNGITGLAAGTYHFQYVLDATHVWIGGSAPTLTDVVINANSKDGVAVPTFNTTKTIPTYKGATDATINVTTTIPTGSKLQYQKDGESTWTDVPTNGITGLAAGTYHFQYVLDATHVWIGGSAPTSDVVINVNTKDRVQVPTDFKTTITHPTYKGATDATIIVTATIPTGSKLQYQKDGESTWTDVPKDKVVKNLSSGIYHFKYVLKDKDNYVWIKGEPQKVIDIRVVKHQTKSKKLLYGIGIGVALLTILPSIYMVIRKRRKAKLF